MPAAPRAAKCPTDLSLERYVLGELKQARLEEVRAHVAGCEKCRVRLEEMAAEGIQFRRTTHARLARERFVEADDVSRRRWKLAALIPAVVLAGLATPSFIAALRNEPPGTATPGVSLNDRRTVLEPAGGAVSAPRTVTVGSASITLGQGTLVAGALELGPQLTEVHVEIKGLVSSVEVKQQFVNPLAETSDVTFLFPLPPGGWVQSLEIASGDRRLVGSWVTARAAKERHEGAAQKGVAAALAEGPREPLVAQVIPAVPSGGLVNVRLRYLAPLRVVGGEVELTFPMSLPGGAPAFPEVALTVSLDSGLPFDQLTSAWHRVDVDRTSPHQARLRLSPVKKLANRHFVLRWKIAAGELRSAMVGHTEGADRTFALLVQPEAREAKVPVLPRELLFLVDSSCSMVGPPLDAAKQAMRAALERMNPDDSFLVIDLADYASRLEPTPLPNTPQNLKRALTFLEGMAPSGGTNQLAGLRAALTLPPDPRRMRMAILLSDGHLDNDPEEVLAQASKLLAEGRLFTVGVGPSPDLHLLTSLAARGRGAFFALAPQEAIAGQVDALVRALSRPVLTNLEVGWDGVPVEDVTPTLLPDLFDGQPLVIFGRTGSSASGEITVHGRSLGTLRETKLAVAPATDEEGDAIAAFWALRRAEALATEPGENAELAAQLGVKHQAPTPFTAWQVVDQGPGAEVVWPPQDSPDPTGVAAWLSSRETPPGPPQEHPLRFAPDDPGLRIDGALSRDTVKKLFHGRAAELEQCVASSPADATRRLTLRVTLDAAGKLTSAGVREAGPLGECVVKLVRTFEFPEGSGSVTVIYPLEFRRKQQEKPR